MFYLIFSSSQSLDFDITEYVVCSFVKPSSFVWLADLMQVGAKAEISLPTSLWIKGPYPDFRHTPSDASSPPPSLQYLRGNDSSLDQPKAALVYLTAVVTKKHVCRGGYRAR